MSKEKAPQKRVDIVIVGAGPATLGLITNAMKTNWLNELVNGGDGIAIIEQGLSFGGGNLQYFGINSNTSANGFLKCTYKKKEIHNNRSSPPASPQKNKKKTKSTDENASPSPKKTKGENGEDEGSDGDTDDDSLAEDSERDEDNGENNAPQNTVEWIPLNCFKDLYGVSPIYKLMQEFGSNIVPLSLIGMFLNYAGNHILSFIHQIMKKKIFYPNHRVTGIQLLTNGEIITTTIRKQCVVKKNESNGNISFLDQETTVQFRSKGIVVSNGGRQILHPSFYKTWFPFMKEKQERVLLADDFLRRDIYKITMQQININQYKNIVIVGGSHSGFSSAWLMLYGPATFNKNNSINSTRHSSMPDAPIKANDNCQDCCSCPEAKKKKEPKCSCLCKCFGFFSYKDWDVDYENDLPKHFEEGSIKILYRDKIRVFYGTVKQAKEDNYCQYNENVFSNQNGYVYSYSGLRGDAKKLFRDVNRGFEKRVKFVKAPTIADQAEHIKQADLVIWSCGYQTNKVTVRDHEGKEIMLSQKKAFTQYDIDGKCRLCVADGSILTKSFGTGIAFPTVTNDGMMADSFSLYCNWVANRVLLNLLPKSILDVKLHRTMRKNRKKAIENSTNNNNNTMNKQSSPDKKSKTDTTSPSKNKSQKNTASNVYKNIESVVKKQLVEKEMAQAELLEKDVVQFPKPNLSTSLIPNKQLARAASQNNIGNTSRDRNIGLTGEPSPMDARKIRDLSKATGQGYMKETVNSKIKQRHLTSENTQEHESSKIFDDNPTYVTVPQSVVSGGKGEALPEPHVFIQPQITKSQEEYIAKRQQMLSSINNQEKVLQQKHHAKPNANHNSVQSRYLQPMKKPDSQQDNKGRQQIRTNDVQNYPRPNNVPSKSPIKRGSTSKKNQCKPQANDLLKRQQTNQSQVPVCQSINSNTEPGRRNKNQRQSIYLVATNDLERSSAVSAEDFQAENPTLKQQAIHEARGSQSEINMTSKEQELDQHFNIALESNNEVMPTQQRDMVYQNKKQDTSSEMSTKSSKRQRERDIQGKLQANSQEQRNPNYNQQELMHEQQQNVSPNVSQPLLKAQMVQPDYIAQQIAIGSPLKTLSNTSEYQNSNNKVSRLFDKNASIRRKQIQQKSQSGLLGINHQQNNADHQQQQLQFFTPKKPFDELPKHSSQQTTAYGSQQQNLNASVYKLAFPSPEQQRQIKEKEQALLHQQLLIQYQNQTQFQGISFSQYCQMQNLTNLAQKNQDIINQGLGHRSSKSQWTHQQIGSSYGSSSASGAQRVPAHATPGSNLNGTTYIINSNQFLKNSGEEIAMGSKHHTAFMNGPMAQSQRNGQVLHPNQKVPMKSSTNIQAVNYTQAKQANVPPNQYAPQSAQHVPIKVFQIPGLANTTARHVLLGSSQMIPPQSQGLMGVQGIQMAPGQNQNYPRPQAQMNAMSVGKQMQTFGATNSSFARDIPISQNENARSFKQGSNLFAQAPVTQGLPPQFKQGEARNHSPNGLKNQQLYVIQNNISQRITERQQTQHFTAQKPAQTNMFSGLELAERNNYMTKSPSKTLKIKSQSIFKNPQVGGSDLEHRNLGADVLHQGPRKSFHGRMYVDCMQNGEVPFQELKEQSPSQNTIMMNINLNSPKQVLKPMNVQLAGAPGQFVQATRTAPLSKQKANEVAI